MIMVDAALARRLAEGNPMPVGTVDAVADLERAKALPTAHAYLNGLRIACCGRYGDWEYLWTHRSFVGGESAVQRIFYRAGR